MLSDAYLWCSHCPLPGVACQWHSHHSLPGASLTKYSVIFTEVEGDFAKNNNKQLK
jgi:hypothetical protein